MKATRIVLILFTALATIAFLFMVAVCITMKVEYWGKHMGNEAQGFFSAAFMLTLITSIPAILLWIALLKKKRQKPNNV